MVYAGVNLMVWRLAHFVLPLASGLLLIPLAAGMTGAWRHWVEEAEPRRWRALMGTHLTPPALRALEGRPVESVLKPAQRQASVLRVLLVPAAGGAWPDDAPELGDMLATCLAPLVSVVHEQGGTFDRYLPRGFIAFWGAPHEDPAHATHALRAAESIRAKQGVLLERCAAHGWAGVSVVCGLASGSCLIGHLGTDVRRDYAAEGLAVEWAIAFAGLAPRYGVDIIATDAIREANPDYAWQELDRLRLGEGVKAVVGVHTPHGLREAAEPSLRSELRLLREALRLYRARDWDAAEINFLNLRKDPRLAGSVAAYLQRIAEFRRQPPPADWDGSHPAGF
jgi:adenylate cyclase